MYIFEKALRPFKKCVICVYKILQDILNDKAIDIN